jgi:hypothetical protein
MGSILSSIYDDYDDYEHFCNTLKVEPVSIYSFHKHESDLLKQIGFKSKEDFYDVLRKSENRDKKIQEILNDTDDTMDM